MKINIKSLSQKLLFVSCATLFSLSIQQSGAASPNRSNLEASTMAQIEQAQVPPLEEASAYLPNPAPERRLVLRLSERKVYLYEGDEVRASYPVAIGRQGWETPTGEFEVIQMVRNPAWENPFTGAVIGPGPQNPLGQRWIGFLADGNNYYGFHGTPDESLIGQAVSHGCVRMRNADIAELFEKVDRGITVTVKN